MTIPEDSIQKRVRTSEVFPQRQAQCASGTLHNNPGHEKARYCPKLTFCQSSKSESVLYLDNTFPYESLSLSLFPFVVLESGASPPYVTAC